MVSKFGVFRLLLLVALLVAALGTSLALPLSPAHAQTPTPPVQTAPPKDYTRATEDQKYLLVMLSPEGTGQPDPTLRQQYSKSGLYPNNGSTTPVWTTDWETWYQNLPNSRLYTTSDGKYLTRLDQATDLALAFYVIGIEVKRYSLPELVPSLAGQAGPTGGPVWVGKAELDPIQRRFIIETTTDERLEFDTTTGQRLPGFGKPDSVALVVAIIAIAVFSVPIAFVAYIGIRRQIRLNRLRKKASD